MDANGKLRIGIVGMGIRGKMFAAAVEQNRDARLSAVSEMDPVALEDAKARFGAPGFLNYNEMLDSAGLDILIVATPDFAHKGPFLAAAAKRINILVEKPLATTLADAEEMYAAVKENKILCRVAFENRWNNIFVAMLEQARDRRLTGEILAINATLNDTIHVPTKMLPWAARSNPAFFLLAHAADLACHAKGKRVKSVYATGVKKLLASMGVDTYDSIMTHIVFEDGAHASFENSWIAPETMPMIVQFELRILGEKRAYMVNFNDMPLKTAGGDQYAHIFTGGQTIDGKHLAAPCLMLHSFIDDVRNGREIYSNEDDGMVNMRILDAVMRSIESGVIINLGQP